MKLAGSPSDKMTRRRKDIRYYGALKKFARRLMRKNITVAGLFSGFAPHVADLLFSKRPDALKWMVNFERDFDIYQESIKKIKEAGFSSVRVNKRSIIFDSPDEPFGIYHVSGNIFNILCEDDWYNRVDLLDLDLMSAPTNEVIDNVFNVAQRCLVKDKASVLAINGVAHRQINLSEAHAQLGKLAGRFLDADQLLGLHYTSYIGNNTPMLGLILSLRVRRQRISKKAIHENRVAFISEFGFNALVVLMSIVNNCPIPIEYKYSIAQQNHDYVRRGYLGRINNGSFKPYVYRDAEKRLINNLRLDIIKLEDYEYLR